MESRYYTGLEDAAADRCYGMQGLLFLGVLAAEGQAPFAHRHFSNLEPPRDCTHSTGFISAAMCRVKCGNVRNADPHCRLHSKIVTPLSSTVRLLNEQSPSESSSLTSWTMHHSSLFPTVEYSSNDLTSFYSRRNSPRQNLGYV